MYTIGMDEEFSLAVIIMLHEIEVIHSPASFDTLFNNMHDFEAIQVKLFNAPENSRVNFLRGGLLAKTATNFEEVFELFHKFFCFKRRELEEDISEWEFFINNITMELIKSAFCSKNKEEADKYYTYWGILAIFYQAVELWETVGLFAGWGINSKEWDNCFDLSIKFDYDFHINEGLDISIFKEFKQSLVDLGQDISFLDFVQ